MCDPVTLFGASAAGIAGGGAAVGGISTVGLLGSQGAFSLATGSLTSGLYSAVSSMGLGSALAVGSAGLNLYGMQQQSNLAEANLRRQAEIRAYDAKVYENNALMAEYASFAEADTFLKRLAVIRAKQSVTAAKSGVVINQDSPLAIAAETAAEGQLEYLSILNKGEVQAGAYRAGAAGKRSAAEQSRINASMVQPATNVAMAGEVAGTGYSLLRNT